MWKQESWSGMENTGALYRFQHKLYWLFSKDNSSFWCQCGTWGALAFIQLEAQSSCLFWSGVTVCHSQSDSQSGTHFTYSAYKPIPNEPNAFNHVNVISQLQLKYALYVAQVSVKQPAPPRAKACTFIEWLAVWKVCEDSTFPGTKECTGYSRNFQSLQPTLFRQNLLKSGNLPWSSTSFSFPSLWKCHQVQNLIQPSVPKYIRYNFIFEVT